jgi:predicted permease
VHSAGIAEVAILNNNEWDMWVAIEGRAFKAGEIPDPHFNFVSPGYFDTLGMRIMRGRDFRIQDNASSPKVAIVNSKFAQKYFPGGIAIGRHIGVGGDPTTKADTEIIGVVNDAHYETMREQIPEQVFLPNMQHLFQTGLSGTFYIQTDRDARSAFSEIRSAVRELDPSLPITNLKTFSRQVDDSLVTERLVAMLSTVFGVLATALVLMGLYGVMAFMVTTRSREIGIRMAVGAVGGDVIWLVMRETLLLIATGMAIGLPAAYALTRVIRAQLYGIEPGDPISMLLATFLLVIATGAAAWIPATRASRFEPLRVLRYE